MRRCLVVSDNLVIVRNIKEVVVSLDCSDEWMFDYRHSAKNVRPGELAKETGGSIDLADASTVSEVVQKYDVVLSGHCKQIFPAALVNQARCYNVHPGLNPHNRGWYPQVFSIINGLPAGATLHEIDEQIDHGRIIAQKAVEVFPYDTSEDVYGRILDTEAELLREHLGRVLDGDYAAREPQDEGNYNSIADFRNMTRLNLEHVGTLGAHLDLLRAMTHGQHRNAYFETPDGKRVYVTVRLDARDPIR
jgi:methionyl-tRNA formyltransferase